MAALTQLIDSGLTFEAENDQLIVAPADRLNDDLRRAVKDNKPVILCVLRHGISLVELRELAGSDWSAIENEPDMLETFAHAVATRRMRESGQVPPSYTAITQCEHCGPVWIWPGCPPQIQACPWCWNRLKNLPMPSAATVGQ